MKFWIARYSHRHGETVWPIWKESQPSLDWLLKTDPDFATDYEPDREDEFVEFHGPFTVPGLCDECEQKQHSS
jgi:hypothetical protein